MYPKTVNSPYAKKLLLLKSLPPPFFCLFCCTQDKELCVHRLSQFLYPPSPDPHLLTQWKIGFLKSLK